MGEFSRALGQDDVFDWQGQTYHMAPCMYELINLWENYLKGNAWRNLEQSKRFLSAETYKEQSKFLQEDINSFQYGFFSRVSLITQSSMEGMQELMALRLALSHCPDYALPELPARQPRLTMPEIRKMVKEIAEHDLEKWAELRRKIDDMDLDPNLKSPATTTPTPGEENATPSIPSVPSSPASPGTSGPGKSAA